MDYENSSRLTNRPTYNEKNITEKYSFNTIKTNDPWVSAKNYARKYFKPSKDSWKRYIYARLPILRWLRKYSVRDNLLKDVIGGLTIGVVQIPQSMGYALMAGVPPVTGLYVSFFTVLIYFFLGTSRNLSLGRFEPTHLSLFECLFLLEFSHTGTYGIVSLMVSSTVEKFEGKLYPSASHDTSQAHSSSSPSYLTDQMRNSTVAPISSSIDHANSTFLSDNPDEAKIMITACIAFFVAIFQVCFFNAEK